MALVSGVDCYQYRSDLGGGKEQSKPVWHVFSPDTHVISLSYSNFQESLGQEVDPIIKLLIGETQISVRIYHEFLIRILFHHFLQESTNS